MSVGFNAGFSNYQFNLNLQIFNQNTQVSASPLAALSTLQQLQQLSLLQGGSSWLQQSQSHMPSCGCIPRPTVQQSGPPAGQGLAVGGAEGFPEDTITTAGGYRIVPEGNTNWEIYAPGQSFSEKAHTRVWGDPHVTEGDGTRWDFTKSSDFVLPDGTRIAAKTSSETGKSVTTGLDITNGMDHVSVTNLNKNPSVSGVKYDGYQWRANHIATDPNRDSFHLRGDDETVNWVRERNGQMEGVVTGAYYDSSQKRYEQKVDQGNMSFLSPEMRPPMGSAAWGNQLRSTLTDNMSELYGQVYGDMGAWPANNFANQMAADHMNSQMQQMLFGGWAGAFGGTSGPFDALSGLIGLLQSESQWQQQLRFGAVAQLGFA